MPPADRLVPRADRRLADGDARATHRAARALRPLGARVPHQRARRSCGRGGRLPAGVHGGLAARPGLRSASCRTADLADDDRPLASLDALVEQRRFAHLLERLPAVEAEVLRKRFYGELSQGEIAAETGIPLGTLKMRMVQALGRLRTLIEEEERSA